MTKTDKPTAKKAKYQPGSWTPPARKDWACGSTARTVSAMKMTIYPFKPKTTSKLLPGHFWAIPLSNGTFSCGRVLQLLPKQTENSRVMFLAGLMDWNSKVAPTSESIADKGCIAQGQCHLRTIWENGEVITGFRDLSLDGIEPLLFRGAEFYKNSHVKYGLLEIRPQEPTDDNLPLLSTWGFGVIRTLAEKRFVAER